MAINNFNVGVGTTSQLTRYRYVATGGETSVSGSDADSKTLSYTVGLEQVFLNGVNLVRGQDYTATDGTSVGSLTALVASDVVEVFAYVPFNIANALTVSTVDAKGDLLVGTGADAVGRLAVGTDGQLLAADSGETSGLKWANGGLTLIDTETFSASAAVNIDDVFSATYDNYKIIFVGSASTIITINFRLRVAGVDASGSNYIRQRIVADSTSVAGARATGVAYFSGDVEFDPSTQIFELANPAKASKTGFNTQALSIVTSGGVVNTNLVVTAGQHDLSTAYDGFTLIPSSGTITGTVSVYGYNK
jgi:hypothetical protein